MGWVSLFISMRSGGHKLTGGLLGKNQPLFRLLARAKMGLRVLWPWGPSDLCALSKWLPTWNPPSLFSTCHMWSFFRICWLTEISQPGFTSHDLTWKKEFTFMRPPTISVLKTVFYYPFHEMYNMSYVHFTSLETEVLRDWVTCPGSLK